MTMMEETSESIGSEPAPAALTLAAATGDSTAAGTNPRQQHKKVEVYNEILRRLKESDNPEVLLPGFDDELWAHFTRLPVRYALDVNVERAEDVLRHKRLLQLARDSDNRPAFDVRLVQVLPPSELTSSNPDDTKGSENGPSQTSSPHSSRLSIHPPPAFGSSANLEMLALEVPKSNDGDENSRANASSRFFRPMHEITFSTDDKPKVLSQLTSLLGEIGLNIEEAHAFSTTDGFSLDVFVVDGWEHEETQQLRALLKEEIMKIEKGPWPFLESSSPSSEHEQIGSGYKTDHVEIPNDGTDVWEINLKHRKLGTKVASGSYGDLYKGTYCSQEVAVKILKAERINTDLQKEFAQEVFIMRKVRHKNVVQFIGACTKPPSLCIVTEFMSCGSVYDYLHKCTFKLPSLLKVAIDVSKGMNYLHQNNIIHRDLKAANLLMDENEEWKLGYHSFWIQEVMMSAMIFHVVKVADFGVVRVKAQTGVMTSEIGTYRWMAPEVIEHKPYDHKADVFSFGIVVWELLTGKLPYDYLTPLQAAVAVVQKGLRPTIPKNTPPKLAELLERCWQQDPALRPDFSEILEVLQKIAKEVGDGDDRNKDKHTGIFSAFKRNHH